MCYNVVYCTAEEAHAKFQKQYDNFDINLLLQHLMKFNSKRSQAFTNGAMGNEINLIYLLVATEITPLVWDHQSVS